MSTTALPECEQLCPHCDAPDYDSGEWCKSCGFYALLNRCIELDQQWEAQCQPQDSGESETRTQPTGMLDGVAMLPAWMWLLMGMVMALTAGAFAFRILVAEGSAMRVVASVGIALGAAIGLAGSHLYAGFFVIRDEIDFRLEDLFLRPVQLWATTLSQLPRTFGRTAIAVASLWTLLLVHLVIGVPYGQLRDLSAPARKPRPALSGVSVPAGGESDLSFEEALEEFSNAAPTASEEEAESEDPLTLQEAIRELLDGSEDDVEEPGVIRLSASIIGYTTNQEGELESLVVAVMSNESWRVAGSVSDGLTPEYGRQLKPKLEPIERAKPLIECSYSATWVEPLLRCTIEGRYNEEEDRFESLRLAP